MKKSLEYSKTLVEDKKEIDEMLAATKELDALFSILVTYLVNVGQKLETIPQPLLIMVVQA